MFAYAHELGWLRFYGVTFATLPSRKAGRHACRLIDGPVKSLGVTIHADIISRSCQSVTAVQRLK